MKEDFKAVFELRDINLKLKAILGEKKTFLNSWLLVECHITWAILLVLLPMKWGFGKGRHTCILVYHNLSSLKDNAEIHANS